MIFVVRCFICLNLILMSLLSGRMIHNRNWSAGKSPKISQPIRVTASIKTKMVHPNMAKVFKLLVPDRRTLTTLNICVLAPAHSSIQPTLADWPAECSLPCFFGYLIAMPKLVTWKGNRNSKNLPIIAKPSLPSSKSLLYLKDKGIHQSIHSSILLLSSQQIFQWQCKQPWEYMLRTMSLGYIKVIIVVLP